MAGARPARTWLVFFRYSNVESVWSRQSEPWQHERWLDGRAADERTTRQWVGGELDELEALDVAAETRELLAAAGDRLEGEIQAELEHATLVAGGITVEERWRRLMEQSVPTPPPAPANASVAVATARRRRRTARSRSLTWRRRWRRVWVQNVKPDLYEREHQAGRQRR